MRALFRPLALLVLTLLAAEGAASAQTTPTDPNKLTAADFRIRIMKKEDPKNADSGFAFLSDIEAKLFFNRARCECDEPIKFLVDILPTGVSKAMASKGTFQLIAGSVECVDTISTTRSGAKCLNLGSPQQLTNLSHGGAEITTTVGALFHAPNVPTNACDVEFQQTLFGLVDSDPIDGIPDLAAGNAPKLQDGVALDGKAPEAPTGVTVTGGNEALEVKWSRGGLMNDLNGSLVFCSRAELPVFKPSYYGGNEYQSQKTACKDKVVTGTQAGDSETFGNLNPDFLCSGLLTTSSEWRIKGLQNGIKYQVGVAAVDTHGNASPIENVLVEAPVQTVDFYSAYRAAGGEASGCAYGGRAPAGGAAILLLALALVRRRR